LLLDPFKGGRSGQHNEELKVTKTLDAKNSDEIFGQQTDNKICETDVGNPNWAILFSAR
jgi:hypothetical protein